MSKRNQRAKAKPDATHRAKVERTIVVDLDQDFAGLTRLPGVAIQAQADRLGGGQLQRAQRQALAAQIGRMQGNYYLQRVVIAAIGDKSSTGEPVGQPGSVKSPDPETHGVMETSTDNAVQGEQVQREDAPGFVQVERSQAESLDTIQLAPDVRVSAGTSWYVEMMPTSSVIPVGTRVAFVLKNTHPYYRPNAWKGRTGTPVFGVQQRGGQPIEKPSNLTMEPIARKTFNKPGHYRVYFRGAPRSLYGRYGRPLQVSVKLDVVKHLTMKTMKARKVRGTLRQDITRAEQTTGAEFVQIFKRIAIRRAIDIVNRNKLEALMLLRKYSPSRGRAAVEATKEIQKVAKLDMAIASQIRHLKYEWVDAGPSTPGPVEYPRKKVDWAKVKRLEFARAALVDAFPAIAVNRRRYPGTFLWAYSEPLRAQKVVVAGLLRVMGDCDRTRRALAIGKLDIFEATGVVAEVQRAMALSKRQKRALERAIGAHKRAAIGRGIGAAGVSLLLLMVPGLGPYLSAAVGLADAAVAWKQAQIVGAAAGAGVRRGIVSSEVAASAQFWAVIGGMLAAVDVLVPVLTAARGIVPHVKAAVRRTIRTSTAAGLASKAPRAASGLESAATGVFKPVAREVPAEYLREMLEQTFEQKPGSWRGVLNVPLTHEEFLAARVRANVKDGGTLAFFEIATGRIHISPKVTNLKEVFHEAIHRVCYNKNPLMYDQLGEFLSEGMTERLAQSLIGRPKARNWVYPEAVAFTALLEQKVGKRIVERAIREGDFDALRSAIKGALGSEWKTRRFFKLARKLSRYPKGIRQQNALRRLLNLLTTGTE